jgi:hypothetical protein
MRSPTKARDRRAAHAADERACDDGGAGTRRRDGEAYTAQNSANP